MEKLIAEFSRDMRESAERNRSIGNFEVKSFDNVLISGLGGSGIGGTILSELLANTATMPIVVNKNYDIPAWVNERTLVIACSYSGNTEETLAATERAQNQGASLAAVTSGGKLMDLARKVDMPLIELPAGYPPRAAFGHGLVSLMALLAGCGVAPWNPDDFVRAADHLDKHADEIRTAARSLASRLVSRIPVLYAAEGLAGVAVRWRQQINENGKMLCWHHILPEMNHNELVGWAGGDDRMGVIFLRSSDDHPRTAIRMDLNKSIISKHTDMVEEVHANGHSRLERMYYLILFGDWLSYYLSVERQVDPVEVDVITHLKTELGKH